MNKRIVRTLATLAALAALLALAATLWAQGIPSTVTIKTPEGYKPRSTWIRGVEFDHDMHSGVAECQTCHHMDDPETDPEAYLACRECHADPQGMSPDGYYKAWHGKGDASCVGCHRAQGLSISCTTTCHPRPAPAK